MREKIIMSLTVEDYYKGPTEDKLNYMGELWEFGKSVDKKEVYIKISKGTEQILQSVSPFIWQREK